MMQGQDNMRTTAVRLLFGLTIGLAAALLFLQQLLLGRTLLPTFGSVPTVWLVSLVVFQTVLLVAYGMAHVTKILPRIVTALLYGGVIAAAIWQHTHFPTLASFDAPTAINAVSVIIALLGLSGVSLFLLSSISPFLQRIYADLPQPDAKDPYFLYSASNFGSFAGLLIFPLALEPLFGVKASQEIWQAGAALFLVLLLICLGFMRAPQKQADGAVEGAAPKPLLWLGLSFLPSAMSFGATSHLINDIAPMPLLSMVPLALYLLTFVLAFSRKDRFGETALITQIFLVGFYIFRVVLSGFKPSQLIDIIIVLTVFFLSAWRCHRELAKLRPATQHLTSYYLMLALGGALGGLVSVFVIPFIIPVPIEFAFILVLTVFATWREDMERLTRPNLKSLHDAMLVVCAITIGLLFLQTEFEAILKYVLPIVLIFSLALCVMLPSALGIYSIVLMGAVLIILPDNVALQRDFFGVKRVIERKFEDGATYRMLFHGTTCHGMQSHLPKITTEPFLYYGEGGGLHDVMKTFTPQRFGVIGLGIGSVACMPPKGASIRFYEIDPGIVELAKDHYTFLKECPAEIIMGDARITLEKDTSTFDVFLMDAFSSDSIPVHLLTREAFEIYRARMAENSVMVVHISNRYLTLRHVVAGAAQTLGWHGAVKRYQTKPGEVKVTSSEYVALSPKAENIEKLMALGGWEPLEETSPLTWTDDHISIIPILHFGIGR